MCYVHTYISLDNLKPTVTCNVIITYYFSNTHSHNNYRLIRVELLAFPYTGDLFSVCCFFVSVSMYQWPVLGSCKCVACVSTCYGFVLRLVERQESVEQSQTASREYVPWHGGVTILCCWANQMLHCQHQSHLCVGTTSGSMAS